MRSPSPVESLLAAQSPAVRTVLDAVRRTGRSAHAPHENAVSDVVFMVAVTYGRNPVELQAEVEAYADALDRL